MTIEWSLAAIQDVIAEAVPTREMLVWKDVRRTWGEVAERSKGLAGFLVGRSIGLRHEREGLERWECGQVPVALVMHNRPEYVESMLACYRARAEGRGNSHSVACVSPYSRNRCHLAHTDFVTPAE